MEHRLIFIFGNSKTLQTNFTVLETNHDTFYGPKSEDTAANRQWSISPYPVTYHGGPVMATPGFFSTMILLFYFQTIYVFVAKS